MVPETGARAYPDSHLMMVLAGERPEEVADIKRDTLPIRPRFAIRRCASGLAPIPLLQSQRASLLTQLREAHDLAPERIPILEYSTCAAPAHRLQPNSASRLPSGNTPFPFRCRARRPEIAAAAPHGAQQPSSRPPGRPFVARGTAAGRNPEAPDNSHDANLSGAARRSEERARPSGGGKQRPLRAGRERIPPRNATPFPPPGERRLYTLRIRLDGFQLPSVRRPRYSAPA